MLRTGMCIWGTAIIFRLSDWIRQRRPRLPQTNPRLSSSPTQMAPSATA